MRPIPVEEFAKLAGGEARDFAPRTLITGFATDNRAVQPGDLFLAIKGERVDGHDFAADAVGRGAVGAMVERAVATPHILVANLVEALARMANHFRAGFHGPVIGVTGSAGKTTAKEFIGAALSPLGLILKTEGNRNTEYTVPLVWPEVDDGTKAVVVEMSMRGFGQIRHLASFSRPTIGVVTNIGYSHMSEVGSREGIAEAKGELLESLPPDGVAVLWAEDSYLGTMIAKAPDRVVTFGFSGNADCSIDRYEARSWTVSEIQGQCFGQPFIAELPAVGKHIAVGASAAVAVAALCGVLPAAAANCLRDAKLPPMRMEVMEVNGATILLDTYNASPPSMYAAIETFTELPCDGRRLAVIGEMRELGDFTEEAHRELGCLLRESDIDEVIFYGEPTKFAAKEAAHLVVHQAGSLDDVRRFIESARPGDAVLVKGSRSLELEKALPVEVSH